MTRKDLLLDARTLLAQVMRFHILSVKIGRLEPIADSGAIDKELAEARRYIEGCDRVCAEIDGQLNQESSKP